MLTNLKEPADIQGVPILVYINKTARHNGRLRLLVELKYMIPDISYDIQEEMDKLC